MALFTLDLFFQASKHYSPIRIRRFSNQPQLQQQNEMGIIIETKLNLAKTLRENVVTIIGKLLFGNPAINLQPNEITSLMQLHALISTRQYPSTNLLELIRKINGFETKINYITVFQHLEQTLPFGYKRLAATCLQALYRGCWDLFINDVDFNVLKGISKDAEKYAQSLSQTELDTTQTIMEVIPRMLANNQIVSTTDLIAGLLVNVPIAMQTPEVSYTESIMYNYLLKLHEGAYVTNQQLGNSKDLVIYVLEGLLAIPEVNNEIKRIIQTLIPFFIHGPIDDINLRKAIDPLNIKFMKTALANNTINLSNLLNILTPENFPNDLIVARKQVISLEKLKLLDSSKIFADFNMFEYRTIEELLLAVLNKLQNTSIPPNLSGVVKALYANAKIAFDTAPKYLSSDLQVDQLLGSFSNIQNQVLMQAINALKMELINTDINWRKELQGRFEYGSCSQARKCLGIMLATLAQTPRFQIPNILGAIKLYFDEVDGNGNLREISRRQIPEPKLGLSHAKAVPTQHYPTSMFPFRKQTYYRQPMRIDMSIKKFHDRNNCDIPVSLNLERIRLSLMYYNYIKSLGLQTFIPKVPYLRSNVGSRRFTDNSDINHMTYIYNL